MSFVLRIVLVLAAFGMVAFVLLNIRRSKLRIEDGLFWVVLSLGILILSVCPQIASFFSRLMGFQAPVNLVFLLFIFVLLVKCFLMSIKASQLETKLNELTEQIGVDRLDHYERKGPGQSG